MLRVNADGNIFIWFMLGTATQQKIEWPLAEFIRLARDNEGITPFKADAINSGSISMLTAREVDEVGMTKRDNLHVRSGVIQAALEAKTGGGEG